MYAINGINSFASVVAGEVGGRHVTAIVCRGLFTVGRSLLLHASLAVLPL